MADSIKIGDLVKLKTENLSPLGQALHLSLKTLGVVVNMDKSYQNIIWVLWSDDGALDPAVKLDIEKI